MTRRFLTAEDVRRLGGPEILLEAGTVVTPQAAEAAAAAGVRILGPAGAYAPPRPDRGPRSVRVRRRGHQPAHGGGLLPHGRDVRGAAGKRLLTGQGRSPVPRWRRRLHGAGHARERLPFHAQGLVPCNKSSQHMFGPIRPLAALRQLEVTTATPSLPRLARERLVLEHMLRALVTGH